MINDEDEKYTLEYKTELVDQVNEAVDFIKKMEPFLKALKKDFKPMISYKTSQIKNYKQFFVNLESYEKVNLLGNVNNDRSKLLFANEENA